MATLHHKRPGETGTAQNAACMFDTIQTFIGRCRRPALLEYGEPIQPLIEGQFCLENRAGRLWIEVFCETRTVSRRILSIDKHATGTLDCSIQRFANKPGAISFLDLDRPQTAHKTLTGTRRNFSEQFRRMLTRQFPGWDITTLSCGLDLQRSFSSVFPRARLIRGNQQIAALACPSVADEPVLLTFALIWFDYISSRAKTGTQTTFALFLPDQAGNLTAQRTRWLRPTSQPRLFRFNEHGSAGEVDPQDLGNLQTRVQKTICDAEEQLGYASPIESPSIASFSERAFEMAVRRNIQLIDATLLPSPVYSQVLAFAAGDRDLIDLVALTPEGRVAVLELKVSEDIHLAIQALDYWMRIKWHVDRNELQHLFPAVPLNVAAPKLLLVAPAIAFHSSCATVLRHFSSDIEIERVGINLEWQDGFRVILRLAGDSVPISHGGFEGGR